MRVTVTCNNKKSAQKAVGFSFFISFIFQICVSLLLLLLHGGPICYGFRLLLCFGWPVWWLGDDDCAAAGGWLRSVGGRRRTDLGSVGATVPGCCRPVMMEAGHGAEVEISPRKAGLQFWCRFSSIGGGRVEEKLREKMDDGGEREASSVSKGRGGWPEMWLEVNTSGGGC
ncbi:hypothetical protein NC651_017417 [Populus alba x Populus x berolinensis]|nr:hypothetical protein NC651_017417 [Populus alba x Populus x berolinensis]